MQGSNGPIQPTIGRQVWYFPAASDILAGTGPLAATVCSVTSSGGKTLVNLGVYSADGVTYARQRVPFCEPGAPLPPSGQSYCRWPDYIEQQLLAGAGAPG